MQDEVEKVLAAGGLLLTKNLRDDIIEAGKRVARGQGRKFLLSLEPAKDLRTTKWPVIVLDCSKLSERVLSNAILKRRGKKMAPMVVVCPFLQSNHCVTARTDADFVAKTMSVQYKFRLIPALVLASVWALSRLKRLPGEAAGRPEKASLADVIRITQVLAVRVGNVPPPSSKIVKATVQGLKKTSPRFLRVTRRNAVYCLETMPGLLLPANSAKAEDALKVGLKEGVLSCVSSLLTSSEAMAKERAMLPLDLPLCAEAYINRYKAHSRPTTRNSKTVRRMVALWRFARHHIPTGEYEKACYDAARQAVRRAALLRVSLVITKRYSNFRKRLGRRRGGKRVKQPQAPELTLESPMKLKSINFQCQLKSLVVPNVASNASGAEADDAQEVVEVFKKPVMRGIPWGEACFFHIFFFHKLKIVYY
ncbi:hypothetical protein ONE63_007324 [Megalurothrips usitatus]|uniref:Uncharacterized protein n=1 Tax=Megalurothrips usitatus TaxID=439358 RepID=A0AAV7XVY7_9NEOP|nr:hypothetical protein ONE63_007324 [Megalurothrips usitatus]